MKFQRMQNINICLQTLHQITICNAILYCSANTNPTYHKNDNQGTYILYLKKNIIFE